MKSFLKRIIKEEISNDYWKRLKEKVHTHVKYGRAPIFSYKYDSGIESQEISEVPPRAKSILKAIDELEKRGVKWQVFHRLTIPQSRKGMGKVDAGYRIIGTYKNKYVVIIESKVGMSPNAAGYIYSVDTIENIDSPKSGTVPSCGYAMQMILKKLDKIDSEMVK